MGLSVKITAHGNDSGFTLGELRQLVQHAAGLDDGKRVSLTVTQGDRPFDAGYATLSIDMDSLPPLVGSTLPVHPPGVRSSFADQRDEQALGS